MSPTTSLKLSQALQDVGVAGIETEKYWQEWSKKKHAVKEEFYELTNRPHKHCLALPAYQFTDLLVVLRKIASKKNIEAVCDKCGEGNIKDCCMDGQARVTDFDLFHFMRISELYAQTESTQGPEKAWEAVEDYLFQIIK